MKSIVVFCGSSEGYNEAYREQAYELGSKLAQRGIRIIYGGAKVGLMGAVADGALLHGGEVVGVIPEFLKTTEVAHEGLTQLITVSTMHARKLKMHELSDGIIAMPGGWGTMEELFEMLTWGQLGLHSKPVVLLNVGGFWNPLLAQLDLMARARLLQPAGRDLIRQARSPDEALSVLTAAAPAQPEKWITAEER